SWDRVSRMSSAVAGGIWSRCAKVVALIGWPWASWWAWAMIRACGSSFAVSAGSVFTAVVGAMFGASGVGTAGRGSSPVCPVPRVPRVLAWVVALAGVVFFAGARRGLVDFLAGVCLAAGRTFAAAGTSGEGAVARVAGVSAETGWV